MLSAANEGMMYVERLVVWEGEMDVAKKYVLNTGASFAISEIDPECCVANCLNDQPLSHGGCPRQDHT